MRAVSRTFDSWAIAIFLALIFALTLFRGVTHFPIGDEMRYFYRFDLSPGQNYFGLSNLKPIQSWTDIAESQANHYSTVNGRIPIHTLEQAFSAFLPPWVFHLLNAAVLIGAIALFVRLCMGSNGMRNPWAWLAVTALLLLLFPVPSRLFTSINLSLNYLWPMALMLALCLAWQLNANPRFYPKRSYLIGFAFFSFFFGWSNEAFSFPICTAMAIELCISLKTRRKEGTLMRMLYILLPMGAGCLVLLFSPGNWLRVQSAAPESNSYWEVLLQIRMIWILLLISVIALCFAPRALRRFLVSNRITIWALLIALAMGYVAHTAARSLTAIETFASILILKAAARAIQSLDRSWLRPVWLVAATTFLSFEGIAAAEHYRQYQTVKEVLSSWEKSPVEAVCYQYAAPPKWLEPFVFHLPPSSDGAHYEWHQLGVAHRPDSKQILTTLPDSTYRVATTYKSPAKESPLFPFSMIQPGLYLAEASMIGNAKSFKAYYSDGSSATLYLRYFTLRGKRLCFILLPGEKKIVKLTPSVAASDRPHTPPKKAREAQASQPGNSTSP